jgi:hypothetical protein
MSVIWFQQLWISGWCKISTEGASAMLFMMQNPRKMIAYVVMDARFAILYHHAMTHVETVEEDAGRRKCKLRELQ